jgi:hypothetical protein
MKKIFVEYRIQQACKEMYLEQVRTLQTIHNFEVWEGTDQPNLFMEEWRGLTFEQYEKLKQSRLNEEDNDWKQLHACIEGGALKIHMWHFTQRM